MQECQTSILDSSGFGREEAYLNSKSSSTETSLNLSLQGIQAFRFGITLLSLTTERRLWTSCAKAVAELRLGFTRLESPGRTDNLFAHASPCQTMQRT